VSSPGRSNLVRSSFSSLLPKFVIERSRLVNDLPFKWKEVRYVVSLSGLTGEEYRINLVVSLEVIREAILSDEPLGINARDLKTSIEILLSGSPEISPSRA